jgi:hypothetical protein
MSSACRSKMNLDDEAVSNYGKENWGTVASRRSDGPGSQRIGRAGSSPQISALEARAFWARYGL